MARKGKNRRNKKPGKRCYLSEMVTHLPPVTMADRRKPRGGSRNRQSDYLTDNY